MGTISLDQLKKILTAPAVPLKTEKDWIDRYQNPPDIPQPIASIRTGQQQTLTPPPAAAPPKSKPSAAKPTPGSIAAPPVAASAPSPTMAIQNAKGLVEAGNLPIWNRPTVQNADGSHSSEYSTSFQDDKGREVLVPTVVNGQFLTPDGKKPKEGSPEEKAMFKRAWQHYLTTGENLGKFDNSANADAYASILHNRGAAKPGKISVAKLQQIIGQKAQPAGTDRPISEVLFGKAAPPTAPGEAAISPHDTGALGRLWENFKLLHIAGNETVGEAMERAELPFGRSEFEQQELAGKREKARREWVASVPDVSIPTSAGTFNPQHLAAVGSDVGTALRDAAEGFLSPSNMLLMAFGGPGQGTVLGRLSHFGFTYQMATGAYDAGKASFQSFMAGDKDAGVQLAVQGLISLGMAIAGTSEGRMQTQVIRELEKGAQAKYNQRFAKLPPEQKAEVLYRVAQQHLYFQELERGGRPSEAQAQAYQHFVGRAEQMVPPPPVSPELDRVLENKQEETERNERGNFLIAERMYQNRTAQLDEIARQRHAEETEAARVAARQRHAETDARLHTMRQEVEAQPKLTEQERMQARVEVAEKEAHSVLEEERGRALRAQQEIEGRAPLEKEQAEQAAFEQARRTRLLPTADRRANSQVSAQVIASIETARLPRSVEADLYGEHTDQLRQQAAAIFPGDRPEQAYERIRAAQRSGFRTTPDEDAFLTLYDRRNKIEQALLAKHPSLRSAVEEEQKAINDVVVQNILDLAHREQGLRDSATTLRRKAVRAASAEEADTLMQQSFEAQDLADTLRAQREQEQVIQVAKNEPETRLHPRPPVNAIMGNPGEVVMVGVHNALPIRYGAIRLSEVVLSHDPWTFDWNPKYEPRKMQPRDLKTNLEAQADTVRQGTPDNIDMRLLLSDDPTSQQGPPVLFDDGLDISGNRRVIMFKRAWTLANEEQRAAMMVEIQAAMEKFGIGTPDLVDPQDPYIPARFMQRKPEDVETLIQLGWDLNRAHGAALSSEETAVTAGARLVREDMDTIATWMEQMPDTASLANLLLARGTQILDLMQQRGIIAENERRSYVTAEGQLNNRAKSFFSELVMGKLIDDADLLATTPAETTQKLERSIMPLVQIRSANQEWQVTDYLKEALRVWKDIAPIRSELDKIGDPKDSLIDKLQNPQNFERGIGHLVPRTKLHPVTEALAKLLEKPTGEVRDALAAYAREAEGRQATLMGREKVPVEEFNQAIGKKVKVEVSPVDWQTLKPATPLERAKAEVAEEPLPKPSRTERRSDPTRMTPPPGVTGEAADAAQELVAAVDDGTVTPESLRKIFMGDPRTRLQADILMKILGEWIPRSAKMPLAQFLKDHMSGVRFGKQAEYEALRGDLKQEGGDIWFLRSLDVVNSKMQGPMPADAALKMLKNNGVKADELYWTGLEDYLAKKEGKVTPQELNDFVRDNAVRVQEVMKGETMVPPPSWTEVAGGVQQTKFGEYVLQGGKNYRELLLTMTERAGNRERIAALQQQRREAIETVARLKSELEESGYAAGSGDHVNKIREAKQVIRQTESQIAAFGAQDAERVFKSHHWQEANVLAHVRFNDRTTSDGRRLLHIEELQSDWHQKGRRLGYQLPDPETQKLKAQATEHAQRERPFRMAAREVLEKLDWLGFDSAVDAKAAVIDHPDWAQRWDVTDPEDVAPIQAWRDHRMELIAIHERIAKANEAGVPDAPFKKTWPDLLVKRMLRYAVDNGYDGISWTGGEAQAERYDLSKKVSHITYFKNKDADTYKIMVYDHDHEKLLDNAALTPQELEELVGKDVAEKIVGHASPDEDDRWYSHQAYDFAGTLDGVDLKIGGEGMRGFYDKIVPGIMNNVGKKFGAKVSEVAAVRDVLPKRMTVAEILREQYGVGYDEATPEQKRGAVEVQRNPKTIEKRDTFQHLPITDELRKSVVRGQPLFQADDLFNGQKKIHGVTQFMDDGRALITLFEGANATTVLHEFFHAMMPFVNEADKKVLSAAFTKDGIWNEDAHELAARTWEKYWADGQAPTEELRSVFARIKEVFRKIYFTLVGKHYKLAEGSELRDPSTGKPIKIKPEVRAAFDRWLGGEPLEGPPGTDMVTLYRGEQVPGTGKPISEWVKESEKYKQMLEAAGRWFTSDLNEAQEYAREAGQEGEPTRIVKVEVPRAELDKYRASSDPEAAKFVHSTKRDRLNDEFFLPHEMARAAVPHEAPKTEMMPPPESLETAITPQEREKSVIVADGNPENSILERMGEARVKRFDAMEDARDWAIRNMDNLWAFQLWKTADGKYFAEFVPQDAKKPLFQTGPPSIPKMVERLDYLRNRFKLAEGRELRQEMAKEIAALEKRLGIKEENLLNSAAKADEAQSGLFAPPPAPSGGIIIPGGTQLTQPPQIIRPDLRPAGGPVERETFFAGSGEKRRDLPETERVGRVPDEAAGLRPPPGPRRLDEPPNRPGVGGEAGRPIPERPDRPGVRGAGYVEGGRGRKTSFSGVFPPHINPPARMREPAVIKPEPWRLRMAQLRMPQDGPAPTMRMDPRIAAQFLPESGQQEVAEASESALRQFDATIIATPGGTGKTFTALGVIKQRVMDGSSKRVIIVVPSETIIKQRNGWRDAGWRKFGLKVEDLPKNLNNLPDGVYITTYDKLRTRGNIGSYPWDLMVADEVHAGRRWWQSQRGPHIQELSDASAKAIYISATPFGSAAEIGYMTKLGLWKPGDFDKWAEQFGAKKSAAGKGWAREGQDPSRLTALRQLLVERGQFITQMESLEGLSADFAVVPLTREHAGKLRDIREAFQLAENFFAERGKPGDAGRAQSARALAVTYAKAYLERVRLPELIEMVKQGRKQGWQVTIKSDTVSAREEVYNYLQQVDAAMDGRISQLLPPLVNIYDTIAKEFGAENVANFSGPFSAKREGEKDAFNRGEKPIIFLTYAAGSEGLNLHDTSEGGVRPRMAFYLGPPYNGFRFEQSLKREWRFGTNSNVHSVFLASNARPELRMLYTKIAPRLEALRAVVHGVDADHRVIRSMKNLGEHHAELATFGSGGGPKYEPGDFEVESEDRIPIQNWAALRLPAAEDAKGKGMKHPGQSDKPGRITLFQEGGIELPPRFLSPEEAKAALENDEVMQALADGEPVPVLGERVAEIEPGERKMLADEIGPVIAERMERSSEPVATARIEQHISMTRILADQEANKIGRILPPGGEGGKPPSWEYETEATPPEAEREVRVKDPWYLSGRESIATIERELGLNLNIRGDLERYQQILTGTMGDLQSRFFKIVKDNQIKKKEFPLIVMVKERQMPAPNARIAQAVQDLTGLLNDVRREAASRGIYVKGIDDNGREIHIPFADMMDDPTYFPHKHDMKEKIRLVDPVSGEEQTFTLGQLLGGKDLADVKRDRIMRAIESKTGWSRQATEDWLAQHKRRVKVAGSLERGRKADFPFYRQDIGVMMEYFHEVGEAFARTEVFGQDLDRLTGKIAQIPNMKARMIVRGILRPLVEPRAMSREVAAWYSPLATAAVITKMSWSFVKAPYHLIHTSLILEQMAPVMRGLLKTIASPREALEFATFSGALARYNLAEFGLDRANNMKLASQFLSVSGFNTAVRFTRATAAFVARDFMEHSLPKLARKDKVAFKLWQQLHEDMLLSHEQIYTAVRRGRWTKDDLAHGAVALVNRGLFTEDPTEMPSWSRRQAKDEEESVAYDNANARQRVASVLHGFAFKTAMIVKREVIDELRKGNIKPLAIMIAAYPFVGEALQATSAAARTITQVNLPAGKKTPLDKYEEGLEDLLTDPTIGKFIHRWIDDMAHATGWTMISHIIDVLAFPPKSKRSAEFQRKNLADDTLQAALGPIPADLWHTLKTLIEMIGVATAEEGDKRVLDEENLGLEWIGEMLPILRGIVPPRLKSHHYEMAPPP